MFLSKSVLSSWAELWLVEDVYTMYIIYFKDHNILTKIMIKTQIRFISPNSMQLEISYWSLLLS